jgi:hypothetical protein
LITTVTDEAKEILGGYECPQGTVLRLDSVSGHHRHDQFCVRIAGGFVERGFWQPKMAY